MKIVIAVDSFKGSLSTMEAGRLIGEGVRRVVCDAEIKIIPVADGGEGTVETIVNSTGGVLKKYAVKDLHGRDIEAPVGYIGNDQAIIEMASACGLSLVTPSPESVKKATTFGLGQQLIHAISDGARCVYIGLGGTATNDGGIGFAQALGYRFYDEDGNLIPDGCASLLRPIGRVDASAVDTRIRDVKVVAITDVDNPLLGKDGSANIFGRQKGMDEELVWEFDRAMADFVEVLERDLNKHDLDSPCAGAGGGMGMALRVFADAGIQRGIDTVLDIGEFDRNIEDADLIITGEGCLDHQSVHGKVPIGVTERALKKNKSTVAVVGSLGKGYELAFSHGLRAVESTVCHPQMVKEAMENAHTLVPAAAERLIRAIVTGREL